MNKISSLIKLKYMLYAYFIFNIQTFNGQSMTKNLKNNNHRSFVKNNLLPISFIGFGLLLNNRVTEKELQKTIRKKVGDDFEFKIDNHLLYTPIIQLYAGGVAGLKTKNNWFNQTKYLIISNTLTSLVTYGLKQSIHKLRPSNTPHSFPSGHTSFAFTNATVLYCEYINSSPIMAYSGFGFASSTAILRIVNNKHWLSDVLTGAGLGILITKLVYHFEPLKNFNPFKENENIILSPQISPDHYGLFFSLKF